MASVGLFDTGKLKSGMKVLRYENHGGGNGLRGIGHGHLLR